MGITLKEIYKSRDYVLLFDTENEIKSLNPNFEKLKKIDAHGFICTAQGKNSDFVSRFFAPQVGINEDPVTGSAHTNLVPFWAERLGKTNFMHFSYQKEMGNSFAKTKVTEF